MTPLELALDRLDEIADNSYCAVSQKVAREAIAAVNGLSAQQGAQEPDGWAFKCGGEMQAVFNKSVAEKRKAQGFDIRPIFYAHSATKAHEISDATIKQLVIGITSALYGEDNTKYTDEDAKFYGEFARKLLAAGSK